jgi:hypothetical protein
MKKLFIIGALGILFWAPSAFADVCAIQQPTSVTIHNFGSLNTYDPLLATPFVVSANCLVTAVGVHIQTNSGTIATGLIDIYSDSGGSPSTSLESHTLPSFSTSMAWATTTFNGTTNLLVGTTYWIVLSQTVLSNTLFGRWDLGVATYGNIKVNNGSAWATAEADGGLFELDGTVAAAAVPLGEATSTVDQAQKNLSTAFVLFFISFFGMIYLLRRRL